MLKCNKEFKEVQELLLVFSINEKIREVVVIIKGYP